MTLYEEHHSRNFATCSNNVVLAVRHRNPPGQGYPTGVLTLPYSGSQGQRSLLTRPVILPGSGQGTLQGRIEVEIV
jgi:hypothetical protein